MIGDDYFAALVRAVNAELDTGLDRLFADSSTSDVPAVADEANYLTVYNDAPPFEEEYANDDEPNLLFPPVSGHRVKFNWPRENAC